MERQALHCVFQPIADLRSGSIFGHEALIRGPVDSPWHRPDVLLALAAQEDLLFEFELFCVHTALAQWGALGEPGRLFVNISADALVQAVNLHDSKAIVDTAWRCGVSPRMLVLELTEHERVSDMSQLHLAVQHLHAAGVSLALDDFGDGRSSLRLWSELKPAYVKIDKYFTRELSERTESLQVVHALKGIAEVFGSVLIAEGIETRDDLRVLRDLGMAYGQGYLLGRPAATVLAHIEAEAQSVMNDRRVAVLPQLQTTARPGVLRHLPVIQAPAAPLACTNNELAELFKLRPELHAIAVVDGERPVALINRQQFMNHYATLYFREVHGRKPCLAYANHSPRVVELDYDVDELVGILTSQDQRYLSDGFIVTDNGRYVGLGTGDQLVRSVTEARIEAARHANPLTFLPGNIPISMHIDRLLDSGTEFVACYADLNHFKPFNDQYGYWRGDEMIRLVARLCVGHCDARRDFVGHVGGDDFMILFQSNNWQQRCEDIIEEFAQEALNLFDDSARQAGGIEAEDRHGVKRFFPCTTLSIGAVRVLRGQYHSAEQVANEAALAKHDAKQSQSGLFVRELTRAQQARQPGH
ncbi:EAL domain-containing protein [Curvibacter sp. RS43]|uniref:EAL domain-containing protein n=1 Tax=Curvibacter microcysteis TaxID=3026419 RepID=A0ABT5MGM0_9BURK|nr:MULTISPECIES: EAL domain-containing protein [unclassified Curvibacter]MDD0810564.1 EAL domain-containing protein [Curvibacter sp. RS43]MDD0815698.1 EAL domain-containing protein [Curvibacter sp. HBC28]